MVCTVLSTPKPSMWEELLCETLESIGYCPEYFAVKNKTNSISYLKFFFSF